MKVFLSHSSQDEAAAFRVKLALETAGYTVVHMSQWGTAESFLSRMNLALSNSDRMLSLWSTRYFASRNCMMELEAAVLKDQRAEGRYLAVARIDEADPPELYAPFIWRQLSADWDDETLRGEVELAIGAPPDKGAAPDRVGAPEKAAKPVFAAKGSPNALMPDAGDDLRVLLQETFARDVPAPIAHGERTRSAAPGKRLAKTRTAGNVASVIGLMVGGVFGAGLVADALFGVNILGPLLKAIGGNDDLTPLIEALKHFNQQMEEHLP